VEVLKKVKIRLGLIYQTMQNRWKLQIQLVQFESNLVNESNKLTGAI